MPKVNSYTPPAPPPTFSITELTQKDMRIILSALEYYPASLSGELYKILKDQMR